jgi:hypothetical protein
METIEEAEVCETGEARVGLSELDLVVGGLGELLSLT